MQKLCLNCNTLFSTNNKNTKYCCRNCANSATSRARFTEDNSIYCDGWNCINSYIARLIFSDGCLHYDKHSHRYKITIALNDISMIQFIHDYWTPLKSIYHQHNTYSIISNNQYDINFLQNIGIVERKSKIIQFPMHKIPLEYMPDFIRGIFDGDRCVYYAKVCTNNKRYIYTYANFSSGSISFLQDLQILLYNQYSIITDLKLNKRSQCSILQLRKISEIQKLYNLMYYDKCLYLLRKRNKFDL